MLDLVAIILAGVGSAVFCAVAVVFVQYVLTFGHLPSWHEIRGVFDA